MVRVKNRYLLVNILYPDIESILPSSAPLPDVVLFNQPTTDALTVPALTKGIRAEIVTLFGDYGSGAVSESLAVKYLSPATSTFILRVSRSHYRLAWAALSLMNRVPVKDGKSCVFTVVRVSGTIRKAEDEAIRRAREMILKAKRDADSGIDSTLDKMFGKAASTKVQEDLSTVGLDDDSEEGDTSEGNG